MSRTNAFVRPHINLCRSQHREDGVNSLPELIEFAAQHNPRHIFGKQNRTGEGAFPCEITFSHLNLAVGHAAAWLISSGATNGRVLRETKCPPVAIFQGSDVGTFIYMAALLRLGAPVLLLSARLTAVALVHLLKNTSPSCVLYSAQTACPSKEALGLLQSQHTVAPKFLDSASYEEFLNPSAELIALPIPPKYSAFEYHDLDAIIMHSSGSTGLPKPICHGQMYPLVFATCHRLPEQDAPFGFNMSTLPLYHGFGLLAPMLSLSIGMPFTLPPVTVIPTGKTALEELLASGARFMLTVPSILEDILRLPGGLGLDALKKLEIVAIGGAPMKESVGSEFAAAGVKLLNHWGSTELGAITPIERPPHGYNWRYLMPRNDLGLEITPLGDGDNTYLLSGTCPGWREICTIQDLLVMNPSDSRQFRIMSRADDLLVLATGEKVRPTNMERIVGEQPDVKDALAFGEGQACLGLLVELAASSVAYDLTDVETAETQRRSIAPYLDRGNSFMDKHGKITNDMIIFIREDSDRRLVRTDKGGIMRKATYAVFEDEIKACYDRAEIINTVPFPVNDDAALLASIRALVASASGSPAPESDDADLFEAGMDSLQASRLRCSIINGLRVTHGLRKEANALGPNFCFENSSVEKLCRALRAVMSGSYREDRNIREAMRITEMEGMVRMYRTQLEGFVDLVARTRAAKQAADRDVGATVLLTGSTGFLGGFLLAALAQDPNVAIVHCLNRPSSGSQSTKERHVSLMSKRGSSLTDEAWAKVVFYEVDFLKEDFGLGEEGYNKLVGITHIIHNAWPVNFNRNLSSFEPHVKGLVNLIRLSILSSLSRSAISEPTRILFASSIAVVGRYPKLHHKGQALVPEMLFGAENTAPFGYAEAKWVCERVLACAEELYPGLVRGANVRIGQMTGAEGSGAWNEQEHLPIVVRTAQTLGALPALKGTLSWIPVNRAGAVLKELLFSPRFAPFYHVENSSRQPWPTVLSVLAEILGGKAPLPLIPFSEWMDRVRARGDDPVRNPAHKLLDFLENNFEHMSSGAVVLDTEVARRDSDTLSRSGPLDAKHLAEYVAFWRSVGAMQ